MKTIGDMIRHLGKKRSTLGNNLAGSWPFSNFFPFCSLFVHFGNKISIFRDNVSLDTINAKIDELMEARNHIMQLRYAHLVEMRAILTDEQKVGYDKGVLNRSAVK